MTAEDLERALRNDLRTIGERLADAEFCGELYRTLANHTWRRKGDDGSHVSLSWKRTEEVINDLRKAVDRPPMELAQQGGEGFTDPEALSVLDDLGWVGNPLNTSRHDDEHLDSPTGAPPPHERTDRFERAHAEADEAQRRGA